MSKITSIESLAEFYIYDDDVTLPHIRVLETTYEGKEIQVICCSIEESNHLIMDKRVSTLNDDDSEIINRFTEGLNKFKLNNHNNDTFSLEQYRLRELTVREMLIEINNDILVHEGREGNDKWCGMIPVYKRSVSRIVNCDKIDEEGSQAPTHASRLQRVSLPNIGYVNRRDSILPDNTVNEGFSQFDITQLIRPLDHKDLQFADSATLVTSVTSAFSYFVSDYLHLPIGSTDVDTVSEIKNLIQRYNDNEIFKENRLDNIITSIIVANESGVSKNFYYEKLFAILNDLKELKEIMSELVRLDYKEVEGFKTIFRRQLDCIEQAIEYIIESQLKRNKWEPDDNPEYILRCGVLSGEIVSAEKALAEIDNNLPSSERIELAIGYINEYLIIVNDKLDSAVSIYNTKNRHLNTSLKEHIAKYVEYMMELEPNYSQVNTATLNSNVSSGRMSISESESHEEKSVGSLEPESFDQLIYLLTSDEEYKRTEIYKLANKVKESLGHFIKKNAQNTYTMSYGNVMGNDIFSGAEAHDNIVKMILESELTIMNFINNPLASLEYFGIKLELLLTHKILLNDLKNSLIEPKKIGIAVSEIVWTENKINAIEHILPLLEKISINNRHLENISKNYLSLQGRLCNLLNDLNSFSIRAYKSLCENTVKTLTEVNKKTIDFVNECNKKNAALTIIKERRDAMSSGVARNKLDEEIKNIQKSIDDKKARIIISDGEYNKKLLGLKKEFIDVRDNLNATDFTDLPSKYWTLTTGMNNAFRTVFSSFKYDKSVSEQVIHDLILDRQLAKNGMKSITDAYKQLAIKLVSMNANDSLSISDFNLSSLTSLFQSTYQWVLNHPIEAEEFIANITLSFSLLNESSDNLNDTVTTIIQTAEMKNIVHSILLGDREYLPDQEQFILSPEMIAILHLSKYLPYLISIAKSKLDTENRGLNMFADLIPYGGSVIAGLLSCWLKKGAINQLSGRQRTEIIVSSLIHTMKQREGGIKGMTSYFFRCTAQREALNEVGTLLRDNAEVGAVQAIKRSWKETARWWKYAPLSTKALGVLLGAITTVLFTAMVAGGLIATVGTAGVFPIAAISIASILGGSISGVLSTKVILRSLQRFNILNTNTVAKQIRTEMTRERIAAALKGVNNVPQEEIDEILGNVNGVLLEDNQDLSVKSDEYAEDIINRVRNDLTKKENKTNNNIITSAESLCHNNIGATAAAAVRAEYVQCLSKVKEGLNEVIMPTENFT
ncbi:hypothetical protein QVN60_05420 [Yersinia aleksiciae]|uniref:hypothetical protein n=2 Tax=Yersinia aleksiciae TaxID=263819 RepID=UPI0025AB5B47|nr:hypothetical protein [Yersinia aleksiciae]MDN0122634.1 hypothetical protein [Yersinia aleksiciae]